MGYFTDAWRAAARDRWVEAPHVRLSIRTVGASPQTIVLTATEEAVSMNPIMRARERKFGSIQAQAVQIQITDTDAASVGLEMEGGWAQIEVGFPTVNVWAVLAVGRIREAVTSIDGLLSIDLGDALVDLMEARTTRDVYFRNTAWAGEIQDMSRSETSKGYNNDASGAGVTPYGSWQSMIQDETFVIEFTSATAFRVVLEDGTYTQTGTITADVNIFGSYVPYPSFERLRINFEGWDQTASAYVAGDKFLFYTSRARTNDELGGMAMVNVLINDLAMLRVYKFATATLSEWKYAPMDWLPAISATSGDKFGGFWPRGSKVIDMVEGILAVLHASLYPMPNGTVHFWLLTPSIAGGTLLNGDPAAGEVSITDGSHSRGLSETYNHIIYRYKNLVDGTAAVAEWVDPASNFDADLVLDVDVMWEVRALSVDTAVSRAATRFKKRTRSFNLETTFDGAVVDIGEMVVINEPALGLRNEQASIVSVGIDPFGDAATIKAAIEELVLQSYGVIGASGAAARIGSSGDPSAGKVW